MSEEQKPKRQDVWMGRYRDITYKIGLHAKGEDYTPNGEGIWNFYIFLQERNAVDFPAIWLEDKIVKWSPNSYGYISYNYYIEAFTNLDFHGGITFYQKHGYTEGYRYIEIGCDYNHLSDQERGYNYNLEWVLNDVKKCIDSVYQAGLMKEKKE